MQTQHYAFYESDNLSAYEISRSRMSFERVTSVEVCMSAVLPLPTHQFYNNNNNNNNTFIHDNFVRGALHKIV